MYHEPLNLGASTKDQSKMKRKHGMVMVNLMIFQLILILTKSHIEPKMKRRSIKREIYISTKIRRFRKERG